jgi:hypothetical protein
MSGDEETREERKGRTTGSAGEEELVDCARDDGGEFEELERHESETCTTIGSQYSGERKEKKASLPANIT